MLSESQQTQALELLRRNAAAARVYVDEKTSGWMHDWVSGDTGGGERTYITTVQTVLIPALERSAAAARDDEAKSASWIENANYAESSLREVKGYALDGTVAELLKATAVQTAADVKDAAVPLSFGLGVGVALVVGLVLLLKFGGRGST